MFKKQKKHRLHSASQYDKIKAVQIERNTAGEKNAKLQAELDELRIKLKKQATYIGNLESENTRQNNTINDLKAKSFPQPSPRKKTEEFNEKRQLENARKLNDRLVQEKLGLEDDLKNAKLRVQDLRKITLELEKEIEKNTTSRKNETESLKERIRELETDLKKAENSDTVSTNSVASVQYQEETSKSEQLYRKIKYLRKENKRLKDAGKENSEIYRQNKRESKDLYKEYQNSKKVLEQFELTTTRSLHQKNYKSGAENSNELKILKEEFGIVKQNYEIEIAERNKRIDSLNRKLEGILKECEALGDFKHKYDTEKKKVEYLEYSKFHYYCNPKFTFMKSVSNF